MRFVRPLDAVFKNQSAVRILRALDGMPLGWGTSGRDIARRAGVSHPTATATLEALSREGLVDVERMAHAASYRLNTSHVFAGPLAALFALEQRAVEEVIGFLREEIERRRVPVQSVYLFGSVARGDAASSSDIDVGVICRPEDVDTIGSEMELLGEAVRRRFGNELRVVVKSHGGGAGAARLWRKIRSEGVLVVGDPLAGDA